MGGKSKKSGGVSKALINRIKQAKSRTLGGSGKGRKHGAEPVENEPEGLFDIPSEE